MGRQAYSCREEIKRESTFKHYTNVKFSMISNFFQASVSPKADLQKHPHFDRQTDVYQQGILTWAHGHLSKLLYVSNKMMASIASKLLHACFRFVFYLHQIHFSLPSFQMGICILTFAYFINSNVLFLNLHSS